MTIYGVGESHDLESPMSKTKKMPKAEWEAGLKKLGLDTHGKVMKAFGVSMSTAQRLANGTSAITDYRTRLMRFFLKHGIPKELME